MKASKQVVPPSKEKRRKSVSSDEATISINSQMTGRTRQRIQEQNRLRKNRNRIRETRKETEKLKALAKGNSMMQMLAKAFRKKLVPLIQQQAASTANQSQKQALKRAGATLIIPNVSSFKRRRTMMKKTVPKLPSAESHNVDDSLNLPTSLTSRNQSPEKSLKLQQVNKTTD